MLKDADSVKAAPVLAEDIINKISQGSQAAPKNSIEDNTSVHAVNEAVEETTKETAKETVGETTKEAALQMPITIQDTAGVHSYLITLTAH